MTYNNRVDALHALVVEVETCNSMVEEENA